MRLERVVIPAEEVHLAGLVYEPDEGRHDVCVVLSHGFTASKETMDLAAAYLCGRGYPCITFDFRGHKLGASTGRLDSIDGAVEDLEAAARWSLERFGLTRCVLAGHSMGGLVSLAVAARMLEVAGVAAIASGPNPSKGFRSVVGIAMVKQRADYVLGAEPIALLEQMDGLAHYVSDLRGRPALFVAARGDVLVKPRKMREMADQAGPGAEYVEIDGSHLEAPDRARGALANWIDRVFGGAHG